MSHTTDVFVSTDEPASAIVATLERVFETPSQLSDDDETPYLTIDTTGIYVGTHNFLDVELPDAVIPLEADYPLWIEVRDIHKDIRRQQETGQRVFNALKAVDRWKLVYLDDFQRLVDSYDPQQPAAREAP